MKNRKIKKFILLITILAAVAAGFLVALFLSNKEIIIEEDEITITNEETITKEDYEQAIKNAEIRFGTYYDGKNNIPLEIIDAGIDANRKEIENERNSRLKEQFRLKDLPNDFYFDTQIPFSR